VSVDNIAYCLLLIAYCLLLIAYCLLLIAYCLLLIGAHSIFLFWYVNLCKFSDDIFINYFVFKRLSLFTEGGGFLNQTKKYKIKSSGLILCG